MFYCDLSPDKPEVGHWSAKMAQIDILLIVLICLVVKMMATKWSSKTSSMKCMRTWNSTIKVLFSAADFSYCHFWPMSQDCTSWTISSRTSEQLHVNQGTDHNRTYILRSFEPCRTTYSQFSIWGQNLMVICYQSLFVCRR